MGDNISSTIQQKKQQICDLQRGENPSCGIVQKKWFQQNDDKNEVKSRDECRSSCRKCKKFTIWEKQKKEHVYDLIDCGKRNRFVIKNNKGEVFISHNSIGHGVDSLQETGSIVVWFGLNYSLELYQQMNSRIDRQGQKKPVSIIHIMAKDTMDSVVLETLEDKDSTQQSLTDTIKKYREGE